MPRLNLPRYTEQPASYHYAMRAGCTLLASRIRQQGQWATLRYCARRGVPLQLALFVFAGRT